MANSNYRQKFSLFSLLWFRCKNNIFFSPCWFPRNRVYFGGNGVDSTTICYSGFAWPPSWLTAQLCKAAGEGSWNKDKESSSQTLKLWLWPQEQHSASWEWTHQACMIQLRQEHESRVLPGIQLIWTQLNCSENILKHLLSKQIWNLCHPVLFKPQASHEWLKNDSCHITGESNEKASRMVTELGSGSTSSFSMNHNPSLLEKRQGQPTYQRPRAASQSRSWSGTHCNGGRCFRSRPPCWWYDAGRLGRWPQKWLCSPPPWLGWLTSDWTRGTTRAGECSDRTAAKTTSHRPLVRLFIDLSET